MRSRPVHFLLAWLLIVAVALPAAGAALGAQQPPTATGAAAVEPLAINASIATPDILVVMLDDHAYIPDQRVLERLPNIRELFLDNGLRFNQMHNETPLCCPSRAGLLSGQHTLRHGILTNSAKDDFDNGHTLAVALDAAGYHTAMVGKYLNRYEGTTTPPGWDEMSMAKGSYRPAFWRNGELTSYRPMFVDQANRVQSREFINEAPSDEPMFLLASVRGPHADQCVNDKTRVCYTPRVMKRDQGAGECAGIADFKPPSYSTTSRPGAPQSMPDWPDGWKLVDVCESLLVIDRMVADFVAAQARRGRPAWYVLLSDNGMAWGQHGDPFKRVPWSTQMPFYINGPGVEHGETDILLSIIDIPATIADIADASMPWTDGQSFLDLLEGGAGGREEVLHVMAGSWNGLHTDDRYYIRWVDGRGELYAYRDDPWLVVDLADSEPDTVAALDARLDELLLDTQAR